MAVTLEHSKRSRPPSDSALRNLLCGKFRYVMRPCHSISLMWSRLNKYKNRGLEAMDVMFDPKVNEFKIKLAGCWIKEWENDVGVHIPGHVITKHIIPFLEGTAENAERRRVHRRDMLRNMIREELVRSNWRDPGHEKVDHQTLFERYEGLLLDGTGIVHS